MELEQAKELQQNIAESAVDALNNGESQEVVSRYEQAIRIIGSTFNVPQNDTDQWLGLIAQRQYELQEVQAGRSVPEYETPTSALRWSGYDTFCVIMDIFGASVSVAAVDERESLLTLTQELMTRQSFQDWVEQCPPATPHSPRFLPTHQVGIRMG